MPRIPLLMACALLVISNGCSEKSSVSDDGGKYELENKREYSIIESEYYLREGDIIDKNFVTVSKFDRKYHIAIIKISDSQYKFSVLLLNPRYPPFEKSFPVRDLEIPDEIKARMQSTSK